MLRTTSSTRPLHAMRLPHAPDSRQPKPHALAESAHGTNLLSSATISTQNVQPAGVSSSARAQRTPDRAVVEQAEVGREAAEGEVERKEEDGDERLERLGQLLGERAVLGKDYADQEAAKDRMNAARVSAGRRRTGRTRGCS